MLFGETVPPMSVLFGGSVPPACVLFGGTVPPNNQSHNGYLKQFQNLETKLKVCFILLGRLHLELSANLGGQSAKFGD